jgi:integrase
VQFIRLCATQVRTDGLHSAHRLSALAAQGASLLEIADVLGHKTLAMVKRYSHLVVDHKAKVIEKMVAAKGL